MSATLLANDKTSVAPWNAVILYDEFESGCVAKTLLDRAAWQSGAAEGPEVSLWRFDVMRDPIVAQEALRKALEAQIVLLAAEKTDQPPDWLVNWLESWASKRNESDALLAAWCGDHSREESLPRGLGRLRQLAGTHGLDFLCADETIHRDSDGSWSATNQ